jgi:Xaa-Pro dipeptidase
MDISNQYKKLVEAEKKAVELFNAIDSLSLVQPGKTERELNNEVFKLAESMFGIKKYWHKRIVRAGRNTLLPYKDNPPDLTIQDDDILFFDFGPVFDEWEADLGRTFVVGNNAVKLKLAADVDAAWHEGKQYFDTNYDNITAAELFNHTVELARCYGWKYGNVHCGHLIGEFPHEKIFGEDIINYIHPDNHVRMIEKSSDGRSRYWIYEIHFVDEESEVGGFFEQLLS